MNQQSLMNFDPATRRPHPYPSHAKQWRDYHGKLTAWLFDPWTGKVRSALDVGSDPQGHLIRPPGEPLYGAQITGGALGGGMMSGGAQNAQTQHGANEAGLSLGELMAQQRQSRITPVPFA